MKRFILAAGVALLMGTPFSTAELVENGDFKKNLPYWHVNIAGGYQPKPTVKHKPGEISFSNLVPLTAIYLSMTTALDIEKGKKYLLSYEVKGPATGSYGLSIGDMGDPQKRDVKPVMHFRTKGKATEKWEKIEHAFTGAFNTRSTWYKKIQMLRKSCKLSNGQTRVDRGKLRALKPENSELPCRSSLLLTLGALRGEISFRNFSVKEVK